MLMLQCAVQLTWQKFLLAVGVVGSTIIIHVVLALYTICTCKPAFYVHSVLFRIKTEKTLILLEKNKNKTKIENFVNNNFHY